MAAAPVESKRLDLDKYRRVKKEKDPEAEESSKEDEIRISSKGRTSNYISYAAKLFHEKELDSFTLKATGQALATAVTVAEIIKRRFKGVHQLTKIGSISVEDEYEPKEGEEGENIIQNRNVSFIEIMLSRKELDTTAVGYQAPLPDSEVEEKSAEELVEKRGGGGSRGKGKGSGKKAKKDDEDSDGEDEKPRKGSKKGSGKGKSGKGSGKKGAKGDGKSGKGKSGKGKGRGKKGKGKNDDSDDE